MHLNVKPNPPQRSMRMPDGKLKIQALGNQKLKVKDILRCRFWNMGNVCLDRYRIIGGFSGKE